MSYVVCVIAKRNLTMKNRTMIVFVWAASLISPVLFHEALYTQHTIQPMWNTVPHESFVDSSSDPVLIRKVVQRGGIPPMVIYLFEVEFRNSSNRTVWLVMPRYLDTRLDSSAEFTSDEYYVWPFSSK